MATKKTSTTRKSSSSSRGRGSRKNTKKAQQAQNQLYAIVLFAVGILLFAIAVIKGENVWLALHNFLLGCLSWCAYLVGPIVVATAVMIATDKSDYPMAAKTISASVLVLLFSGALQIFHKSYPRGDFLALVQGLYREGKELTGGGVLSLVFGVPLLKFTNFLGAAIIILLLIFIFVMILSGGTLMGLMRGATAPVRRIEEAYSSAVETRAVRESERPREIPKAQKAPKSPPREEAPVFPDLPPPLSFPPAVLRKHTDIDVPIDGEPLPKHGERAPKTAIRPEPLPPEERGRLAEEVASLPRKEAYNFDRQDPAAKEVWHGLRPFLLYHVS